MSALWGTRYLLLTCTDPAARQFRGIGSASELLAGTEGVHHLPWNGGGEPLDLAHRRTLQWVAVSGHGAGRSARISDGHRKRLRPRDLAFPSGVDLYLLACYQGRLESTTAGSTRLAATLTAATGRPKAS